MIRGRPQSNDWNRLQIPRLISSLSDGAINFDWIQEARQFSEPSSRERPTSDEFLGHTWTHVVVYEQKTPNNISMLTIANSILVPLKQYWV